MRIQVIPTNKFISSNIRSSTPIRTIINRSAFYIERDEAEKDSSYLQIIPYIIVWKNNEIFTYTRLKKGSENRLHNKLSIGIGGHIDYNEDLKEDHMKAIEHSSYRELFEELDIELNKNFLEIKMSNRLIYDPSNEVGKVHLGILGKCDLTGRKVEVAEKEKIDGEFLSIKSLKEKYKEDINVFETWTQIALKELKLV